MKKTLAIILFCLLTVFLGGCKQNTKNVQSITPTPSTSSQENNDNEYKTQLDTQDFRVEEVVEEVTIKDTEINIKNPTSKINQALQKRILNKEVVKLYDGVCLDLNNDGKGEVIHFKIIKNDNDSSYIDEYTLSVGNRQVKTDIIRPSGEFYGALLGGNPYNGIQILINGDGPSSDPNYDIYHYQDNQLLYVNNLSGSPESIQINNHGFTGSKRGHILQTWYREADYVIMFKEHYWSLESEYTRPIISEVPRDLYTMGNIVKLKQDLALHLSRTNTTGKITFPKGMKVCLATSDDVEWVYIVPVDKTNISCFMSGGWLKFKIGTFNTCLIDSREICADDLFDGLTLYD